MQIIYKDLKILHLALKKILFWQIFTITLNVFGYPRDFKGLILILYVIKCQFHRPKLVSSEIYNILEYHSGYHSALRLFCRRTGKKRCILTIITWYSRIFKFLHQHLLVFLDN